MKDKNHPCSGCGHYRGLENNSNQNKVMACLYILDTKKKRPCTAGAGCTEYTKRRCRCDN